MSQKQNKKRTKRRNLPGNIEEPLNPAQVAGSPNQHTSNAGFPLHSSLPTADPVSVKLGCIFHGKETPFTVQIQTDVSVYALKKSIKEKMQHKLNRFVANELQIWKLNDPIPADEIDGKLSTLGTDIKTFAKKMNPMFDISDYFPPQSLLRKHLHIIVEVPRPDEGHSEEPKAPSTRVATLPPSPLKTGHEASLMFKSAEALFNTEFTTYLNGNAQLPVWEPKSGSPEIRAHIASLKIPVGVVQDTPSLLLHRLGELSHDSQLLQRVEHLFKYNRTLKCLCNTSGSGKTRLLFEGLWRTWGMYFTTQAEPDGIGSSDVETILKELKTSQRFIPHRIAHGKATINKYNADSLRANNMLASRLLLVPLYIRTLALRVYLQCAQRMPGGITEKHKGLWLLLQIAPEKLLSSDIFFDHVLLFKGVSKDLLWDRIVSEREVIQMIVGGEIFCVLDEAQVIASKFSDYFVSVSTPLFREAVQHWHQFYTHLIVSGTRISMMEGTPFIGSASICKDDGPTWETIIDVGGFDDQETQQAYLQSYLPPGYLKTPIGQIVASRAWRWLHGCHRFTASYIERLVAVGFKSPNRILSDYVQELTNFKLLDHDHENEPTPTNPHSKTSDVNFSGLFDIFDERPRMFYTMTSFLFEYLLTGEIRGLRGPEGEDMVELGVSRFESKTLSTIKIAKTDEPLAILALVDFLSGKDLTLESYLASALDISRASARDKSFEHVGAYLLARAFSSPRDISEVFTFYGDTKLRGEKARIVTLQKDNDTMTSTPFDINTLSRSSHRYGCSPSTKQETLDWLLDPKGSAFCFPTYDYKPDLLFALELESTKEILNVCAKIEHRRTTSADETEEAINTTNPKRFLTKKKAEDGVVSHKDMQNNIMGAIENHGTGTDEAGEFAFLQVLMCHPCEPDEEALEKAAKDSHYPIATVNIESLDNQGELAEAMMSFITRKLGVEHQPSRNRGVAQMDIDPPRPKKRKRKE